MASHKLTTYISVYVRKISLVTIQAELCFSVGFWIPWLRH